MSDTPNGNDWWQASDLKWYPPQQHPNYVEPAPPAPPPPPPPINAAPAPGYWKASDGEWYPPERHPDYVPPTAPPAPPWTTSAVPQAPATANLQPFAPFPPAVASTAIAPQSTNGLAIASLVLAIAGAFLLFGIGALLAVFLGHIALGQVKRSGGTQGGRGLAVAGLVIGYIELLVIAVVIAIIAIGAAGSSAEYQVEACEVDLRTLQTAVAAYNAELGAYPSVEADLVNDEFLEYESDYYDYEFDGSAPVFSLQPGSDCPEP
jgi:hypothetical protein